MDDLECLLTALFLGLFILSRLGILGRIQKSFAPVFAPQLDFSGDSSITFFAWVFGPALGWGVGWYIGVLATKYLNPASGGDLSRFVSGLAGLFLGVAVASHLTESAFIRLSPMIEDDYLWNLAISLIGRWALGILIALVLSPCTLVTAGMGCDLPTTSQTNACVRGLLYFGSMLSYVFFGAFCGIALGNLLKRLGFEKQSDAVQVTDRAWFLMFGPLILVSGIVFSVPAKETEVILLSAWFAIWVAVGFMLKGIVIGLMMNSTLGRIKAIGIKLPNT